MTCYAVSMLRNVLYSCEGSYTDPLTIIRRYDEREGVRERGGRWRLGCGE